MKVAVVSSTVFPCPPPGYSGLEHLAWLQAKGLAERGHQVYLIAPEGSTCEGATVVSTGPAGKWDERAPYGGFRYATGRKIKDVSGNEGDEIAEVRSYWPLLLEMDAIIDSSWAKWSYMLKMEGRLKAPILGVMHAPVNTMYQTLPPGVEKPCFVCISNDQAAHFEALHSPVTARVAYNGCFDGSTVLILQGGKKERIDSYVWRSGREPVLAWSETDGRLVFTEVKKTLEYQPTNPYAVTVRTESGLTLISTPDNPIMTKRGWVPAYQITVSDEVLCGDVEEVESGGGSLPPRELQQTTVEGYSSTFGSDGIVGERGGEAFRSFSDTTAHQINVDERRRGNSPEEVFGEYRRGTDTVYPNPFGERHTQPSTDVGAKAKEECLVQTDGKTTCGDDPDGCGVPSWNYRWRGVSYVHARQTTIHPHAHAQCVKLGSTDNRLCENALAGRLLARGPTGGIWIGEKWGDQEPTSYVAGYPVRTDCRGGDHSDAYLPDGEGRSSTGGGRVLSGCIDPRVVERTEVHSKADRAVSVCSPRELPFWDRVVSVERVSTPPRVFDLQTGTGSFVANSVVVHNCDPDFYKPIPGIKRSDRMLFLARFSAIKGADIALEVCHRDGYGLDLVGDTQITSEPEYFEHCRRRCDGVKLKIVGNASRGECVHWFSQAFAMLHPNQRFREPFGLAPVEAMLCGCPVVAWKYGALKETVKHGETGYLVSSIDEMQAYLRELTGKSNHSISVMRANCRDWAAQFSVERMIKRYEELCVEAIDTGGW